MQEEYRAILSHFDDDGNYKACKGCKYDCSVCTYTVLNSRISEYIQAGFTPREVAEMYLNYGNVDMVSEVFADLLVPLTDTNGKGSE